VASGEWVGQRWSSAISFVIQVILTFFTLISQTSGTIGVVEIVVVVETSRLTIGPNGISVSTSKIPLNLFL
jgi:hypothetical protein